ncbi:MAG: sugar dehydrogenase complex small subunit [Rhodobacterales bacterium]|nr:sugar dehydrogenase complex small subunit [Rhodobacterales bacterium]
MDVHAFLALSQKLVEQDDLTEEIAAEMLKAFVAAGREDDIAALSDGSDDDAVADEIVAAWYTGVSPDPDDPQVLAYTDALIWQAMDYRKPQAVCGGGVGYWGEPPEA